MSLEGNKNRIHEGILDSLLRSQKRQSILDMRFARNKRAFGRAWDKTVERFGGKRGETKNPIIKGIMPDGSEAPGHRGRWKETETSNTRDEQWLQTYRKERSARLKRSDAVRSSIERIAAGVLAGTMALTGRGLLTPNVVNKAAMDKEQELRQSIDNKQRRDDMSLENTLREMLNEMKVPEKGKRYPTDPSTTADQASLPIRLLKHDPNHPKGIGREHPPVKGKPGKTLKEHYKQRLDEAIPLDILRDRFGSGHDADKHARYRRTGAAAAAAGSTPKGGKPKDSTPKGSNPKGGKPVEGASPATTPAPQIDLNALRASRQSG